MSKMTYLSSPHICIGLFNAVFRLVFVLSMCLVSYMSRLIIISRKMGLDLCDIANFAEIRDLNLGPYNVDGMCLNHLLWSLVSALYADVQSQSPVTFLSRLSRCHDAAINQLSLLYGALTACTPCTFRRLPVSGTVHFATLHVLRPVNGALINVFYLTIKPEIPSSRGFITSGSFVCECICAILRIR